MPNDPLIEAIARAISASDATDPHQNYYMALARAAIAALKAEGWMLVRWEHDPRMRGDCFNDPHCDANTWGYADGKAYRLVGLEPPAAALAGRP